MFRWRNFGDRVSRSRISVNRSAVGQISAMASITRSPPPSPISHGCTIAMRISYLPFYLACHLRQLEADVVALSCYSVRNAYSAYLSQRATARQRDVYSKTGIRIEELSAGVYRLATGRAHLKVSSKRSPPVSSH